jgi:hypothetical protein
VFPHEAAWAADAAAQHAAIAKAAMREAVIRKAFSPVRHQIARVPHVTLTGWSRQIFTKSAPGTASRVPQHHLSALVRWKRAILRLEVLGFAVT